jgi:predicted O-linked N-acetylglucosamine transferase (SPINDLY family)
MTATDRPGADADAASNRLIEAGHRLEDAGDIAGALAKYQEAVAASPMFLRGYLNVGNALQRLGRTSEAVAALESALRIDPGSAPCHFNLGNIHAAAGDHAAAEREFRAALQFEPAMTGAGIALANVLEAVQRPQEAEQQLRQLLSAAPDCAPAAYNLALLLQKRDEFDEAEQWLRRCVDADPAFLMAYVALGDLTRNAGRSREAEPWYRKALAVNPRSQEAWSALLLSLNNRDDLSAQQALEEHLRFGEAFPATASEHEADRHRTHGHTRIRVGYLSGDFIQHAVALFLRPVLMHRDRAQFEVFCYSNNAREDGMTRDIRSRVEHWRNIAGQDDAAAARTIRADELDILIDLSGHSARSRILLFNQRCAPVQATWLGYLNTTGLRSADYRLCDRYTDPAGVADALHTETLIRLPESQWCYLPAFEVPRAALPVRDHPDRVVFGSFNHVSKLSDHCVDLWCRVLRAVPGSVLRLHAAPPGRATDAIRRRFEDRGIEPGRIYLFPRSNIDAYFAAIGDVDVALDTFPYSGGTTTCDVLWMEVPLVALAGDRPAARSGVSLLTTLQLPELIAATDDEYVAINVKLAADAHWRRDLRTTLRARMQASPLMDAARFVRGFEDCLRGMLHRP